MHIVDQMAEKDSPEYVSQCFFFSKPEIRHKKKQPTMMKLA